MGDKVKTLRKENDELKRQLQDVKKEFESIKTKMAEQRESHEVSAAALPNTQDVQFLSDSYDTLVQSKSSMDKVLKKFSRRLDLLSENVDRIDKAIDEMLYYTTNII